MCIYDSKKITSKISKEAEKTTYRAKHLKKWDDDIQKQKKENENKAQQLLEKDAKIKEEQMAIQLKYDLFCF